jgi:hypothetical protein
MADNALVIWCVTERPRHVENELLINVVLPLNLESNARCGHPVNSVEPWISSPFAARPHDAERDTGGGPAERWFHSDRESSKKKRIMA